MFLEDKKQMVSVVKVRVIFHQIWVLDPRQFHCIIVCLQSMTDKKDKISK